MGLWFESNHTYLQCTLQLKELSGQQATLPRKGFAVSGFHRVTVEQPVEPPMLELHHVTLLASNVTDMTCELCGVTH